MSLRKTCFLFLLLVIPNPIFTSIIDNNNNKNDIHLLERMMLALFRLLNCIKNTKQIDMNLAFGIAMTAGQLKVAMRHLESSTSNIIYQLLFQMEELCLNLLDSLNKTNNEDPLLKILSPSLWEIDLPNKKLNINLLLEEDSFLSKDKFINPTEAESDLCLKRLLKNCTVNSKCLHNEYDDNNIGYSLTHQVIYWQLFRQVNCRRDYQIVDIDSIIENKCTRIFQEITNNFEYGGINTNEDLFLEQVAICGLENYEEFLLDDLKNIILQLQMDSGCYQITPLYDRQFTDEEMNQYNNHISSVASLALTVQVKDIIRRMNK